MFSVLHTSVLPHPRRTILTFAVTLLTAASLLAQAHPGGGGGGGLQPTNPNQQNANPAEGSLQDHDFVKKALAGGQMEIQLSQLALQKSQSDDVKQFAQKMIDDHTQMGTSLQPIAHQFDIEAPKKLSKKEQQMQAKMQGLSGADFDTEYVNVMAKDHAQVLKDFKTESGSTQDPNVKQFIAQYNPVVAGHLEAIQTVAKNHNITIDSK